MNTSQTTFVDKTIARRLELAQAYRTVHYAEGYAALHRGAGSTHQIIASGIAIFISPNSPVNKAAAFGLDEPFSLEKLKQVEDFFSSRGARPVFSASPLSGQAFFNLLSDNGYRIADFLNVLWWKIPPGYSPGTLPDNIKITRAGV